MESGTEQSSLILKRDDLNLVKDDDLTYEFNLNAAALYSQYPPKFRTRSKLVSYNKVTKEADYNPRQIIRLSHWKCMQLPEIYYPSQTKIICSDTVFQYAPREGADIYRQIDWHINFADSSLFGYYSSSLLAQDELQVLECPILASVREFLVHDPSNKESSRVQKFPPYTIGNGEAAPILIGNADRVISLDTYPDASKDRPYGLYGNNFERASDRAVDLATNIIKSANKVNILAIKAPSGGDGAYNKATIESILKTCYTGFAAAKRESQKLSVLLREEQQAPVKFEENEVKTNIFTGFWGCGAYGGDRTLMVILQIIGARLAGIDSLTIHAVHKEGEEAVKFAITRLKEILGDEEMTVEDVIRRLEQGKFRWGYGNGT